jgi:hypothetical protein
MSWEALSFMFTVTGLELPQYSQSSELTVSQQFDDWFDRIRHCRPHVEKAAANTKAD